MTNWSDFAAAAPEAEARARSVLAGCTNAVLGTIRADGSPRLSGIDPWFSPIDLCFGSMPGARKLADLARDRRLALHSVPWESRRPPAGEGPDSIVEADVKVAGLARPVSDPAERRAISEAFAEARGFDIPGDPGGGDEGLFAVEVTSVAVIAVAGEELVIEHWSPAGGLRTVRRS